MKKLFFLLLFLFLCTGCSSISYNVNFSNTINENIIVVDETHIHNNELEDGFMGDISAFEFFFQTLPYRSSSDGKGTYYAKKEFSSITDYLDQSFVYSKFLDQNSVKINGSKVKINIEATDELKQKFIETGASNLEISLYIPYYVTKHNATSVNNNNYIWSFDDLEKAKIKINFDMSKSYDYRGFISSLIVIIIVVAIIATLTVYFIKRNKEVNDI